MQEGCAEEVWGPVDVEALRARGRERVVEDAVHVFLMQSHMRDCKRRDFLHFRACMDGTVCQVRAHRDIARSISMEMTLGRAPNPGHPWSQFVGVRLSL